MTTKSTPCSFLCAPFHLSCKFGGCNRDHHLTQNKLSTLDLYIYAILTSKSPCTKSNQMSDAEDPKKMQGIEFEPYILHTLDDIVLAKHLNSHPF